ncbi:MAG: hypothetical protein OER12_09265 [Acidimicrobiia bacterium]|nr:hypothetical protein [Acidimicrobiia bacterium]
MRSLAVVTVLAMVLVGCGGSDSDSGASSTAAPTSATSSDATTTTAQTPATSDGSSGEAFSLERCPEFAQWAADAAAATQAAFTGGGTNAAGIAFSADYFQEFADRAPGEIKDDMRVFAGAFSTFFETLEDLEFDFTDPASFATLDEEKLQRLEDAAALMDTDEVNQAADNVAAFFERECT